MIIVTNIMTNRNKKYYRNESIQHAILDWYIKSNNLKCSDSEVDMLKSIIIEMNHATTLFNCFAVEVN